MNELVSELYIQLTQKRIKTFFFLLQTTGDCIAVASFGKDLTINGNFILRYPISCHQTLYHSIGAVTRSLTVSNIDPEQAKLIFSFFKNLDSLTVEKLTLNEENCRNYPPVRSLKLSQCWSEHCILQRWFEHMILRLESIHFDRITCNESGNKSWDFDDTFALKCVRHLIVERMESDYFQDYVLKLKDDLESLTILTSSGEILLPNMSKLRRLTIDGVRIIFVFRIELPSLEFLSVRSSNVDNVIDNTHVGPSLKTFECRSASNNMNYVLKLKHLEHVKLLCNWYQAKGLRTHFLSQRITSFELTYFTPAEGYDIFHSLNEECLRKILSFLPINDLATLPLVHPNFVSLVPCLIINFAFLEKYPLSDSELYKGIGKDVYKLRLEYLAASNVNQIIPNFQKVRGLTLVKIFQDQLINWNGFPLIDELHVHGMNVSQWKSLFRRIEPTLKRFQFIGDQHADFVDGLKELTNLEHLSISGNSFRDEDFEFLQHNKNMIRLQLNIGMLSPLKHVNADSLRSLILGRCPHSIVTSKDVLLINRFQKLDHLSIRINNPTNSYIGDLQLDHLRSLALTNIESLDSAKTMNLFLRFPNLKVLRLTWSGNGNLIWQTIKTFRSKIANSNGEFNYAVKKFGNQSMQFTRPQLMSTK